MKKRIVFTGGGTAGHVTPNLALMEELPKTHWDIHYIGSKNSIEAAMMQKASIPFHAIRTGKLRRHLSINNFFDPINILIGIIQAFFILGRIKPHVIFSKGGFVAFPVVFAAWLRRIPVIAHESDQTPGLANRLSMPFVDLLCVTFEPSTTSKYDKKIHVTGTPLRRSLFLGDKNKGLDFCGFNANKPCLLVMGGSMGSVILNQTLRESLNELTTSYQIIHLCGRGNIDSTLKHHPHYQQFEYIDQELPDLIAASDIMVSRAGANSVYEWLALKKLHLLVPLSKKASRGDQIDNARYFEAKGTSLVVDEEAFSPKTLIEGLSTLETQKKIILKNIDSLNIEAGNGKILKIIEQYATLKQSG